MRTPYRASVLAIVSLFATLIAVPASAARADYVPQRVIVWDGVSEATIAELQGRFEASVVYRYDIIDGVAVSVEARTAPDVLAFAAARGLRAELDQVAFKSLTNSTKPIHVKGANRAWADGWTGEGSTIAVIDTGIDANHAGLNDLDDNAGTNDPKVLAFRDWVNNGGAAVTPYDDEGHGSHVAGIAAGTGQGTTGDGPGGKNHVGVAYKANLVGLKVLDSLGSGFSTDIIAAINWARNNANSVSPPIRVINMSLGVGGTNNGNSATSQAADAAANAGIIVVAAGGNGTSNGATPNLESGNINIPADARNVIAVCSSNSADPPTYSNWDSEGPTADGRMKPDVCAPGDSVQSVNAGTASGYTPNGGTSMSSPHVAGIAAMIKQAVPLITPAQVKAVLQETARNAASPNNDRGWGEAQAKAAIDLAIQRHLNGQTPPLVANAGGPYSATAGGTTPLFASATGGLPPYSFAWDLDDDGQFDDATGAAATFAAGQTLGVFPVKVRVTDVSSPAKVSTASSTVEVVPAVEGWLMSRGNAARTGLSRDLAGMITGRQLQSAALPGPVVGSPLIADLDGDDRPEIIVGADRTQTGRVSVHAFAQGPSGLVQRWRYDVPTGQPGGTPTEGFVTLAAGDLDLDGDLEIVAYSNHTINAGAITSNEGRLSVLSHAGALVADSTTPIVIGRKLAPAIGDVTGDGRPDIVIVRQTGGTGAAAGHYLYGASLSGSVLTTEFDILVGPDLVETPPALGQIRPATPGLEAVVGRWSANNAGTVWVCSAASCGSPVSTPTGPMGLAVADLDGDGAAEIAVNGRSTSSTVVLEDNPLRVGSSLADGSLWNTPTLGDVDADGRPDIVNVQHSDFVNDVFHDGTVQVRSYVAGVLTSRGDLQRLGDPSASAQGEFGGGLLNLTGSATPEFVFGTEAGRLEAVRFGPTGAPAALWGMPLPGRPSTVAFGDVTGDGFAEIVIGAGSNVVVVGNRAPVLGAIGDRSAVIGQPLTFSVSATDPDGDPVTLSATNLPAGANFNPSTGAFTFTPSSPGVFPGVRFIASDGALTDDEVITISVGGSVPGALSASPTNLSFPVTQVHGSSATQAVTITNAGPGVVAAGGASISGSAGTDFVVLGDTCSGQNIAAGGSCQIQVAFAPTALGARSASLVLPNNGTTGPVAVGLSGTAQGVASIGADPAAVSFGSVKVGSTGPSSAVAIRNSGTDAASIGGVALQGTHAGDYAVVSNGCAGVSVAPGGSCSLLIRFTPGATGVRSATLRVPHSAGSDLLVAIGGTGATGTPKLALSRQSIAFGSQWVLGSTDPVSVGVTNAGDGALAIGSVGFTGANAGDFALVSNDCSGRTLAVGGSCTVQARFAPTAAGARSASLVFPSNAAGPHEVAVAGTGVEDAAAPSPTITTSNNSVIVRGAHRVAGNATDDLSGIATVMVGFTYGNDAPVVREAAVSCSTQARTSCTWSVAAPRTGSATVNVVATDRVAKTASAGPVSIIVI